MNRIDRFVVRAFVAWQTFTVRCGLVCTRFANSLPPLDDNTTAAIALCVLAVALPFIVGA